MLELHALPRETLKSVSPGPLRALRSLVNRLQPKVDSEWLIWVMALDPDTGYAALTCPPPSRSGKVKP